MELQVKSLSHQEFADLEHNWSSLLDTSLADPLFMSWPWLYSWWDIWGDSLGLELVLLGVYQRDGRLVGIAPLYRHRFRIVGGMKVTRLHFLGNAWRVSATVRTEYVGLIAECGREQEVANAVADFLQAMEWDELVIPDSQESNGGLLGEALANRCNTTPLLRNESRGVRIDATGSFALWLEELGPNTRRKAFNRRAVFEGDLGGHWQACGSSSESVSSFMASLNEFHQSRWGKPCFDEKALAFHLKLLGHLSADQQPALSRLMVGDRVISVLYDIRAGDRIYNLQAGYEEQFHPKLSLGTLHLGYAMEQAFQHPEVRHYDLLAGSGKNTFYKARFNGQEVNFPTVDLVRSPVLRVAYQCRSCLPKSLVSRINRVFRL